MYVLWIKAFHIVFVIAWFCGLLYLPRILVNLSQETDATAVNRLLGMARRLYRFTNMLSVITVLLGAALWAGYGYGPGPAWLHAKVGLVVLVIGYQHACGSLLKKFEMGKNTRSHVWLRWFNEVPALLLLAIVILVVVKPF
ncbi:MAG: putative rane protein [Herbaspirillum sp.]|jgi:putative membrane protein|nr:putative rane protein [Herbaspirillum sp.]